MFYETSGPSGLPHDPFKALAVPRPIGWISSLSGDGQINLAPYSFFNAIATNPPMVVFGPGGQHSGGGLKDTIANIEKTGEFVCNMVTWGNREAMNRTSAPAPRGIDEFAPASTKRRIHGIGSTVLRQHVARWQSHTAGVAVHVNVAARRHC